MEDNKKPGFLENVNWDVVRMMDPYVRGNINTKEEKKEDESEMSVKLYELEGKPVKEVMEEWKKAALGIGSPNIIENTSLKDIHSGSKNEYKSDMLCLTLTPRWKRFRPPFSKEIKIFKWTFEISFLWAYKITKACTLKNAYPTSIDSIKSDGTMEFKAKPFDEVVKDMEKVYKEYREFID